MTRSRRALAAATLSLALAVCPPVAQAAQARFNVEVPAGKWKGLRVKNLPAGAEVRVEVRSEGEIRVLFLEGADLKRMPSPARPLFDGMTADRISITLRIPATGHYYVILDNRSGSAPRRVRLTVAAAAPARAQPEVRSLAPEALRPPVRQT